MPNALSDPDESVSRCASCADESTVRRIVCVGRLNWWKGQDDLIEAFGRTSRATNGFRLEIAGGVVPGDEERLDALRSTVERLGIADRVSFLGEVDSGEALMQGAELVVVPSKQPEPFGLVVLEAFRAGAAVIASDAGGPAEIIQNRENGLLFKLGDVGSLTSVLNEALADDELRSRLRAGGRDALARYSPKAVVEGIAAGYRALLPSHRNRT